MEALCGPDAPSPAEGGRRLAHHRHGRRPNPNNLGQISETSFDLRRAPFYDAGMKLEGVYRTDTGIELAIWADVGPDGQIRAPFNVTVYAPATRELFHLEDYPEQYADFETAMEALGAGLRVATEIDHARWLPGTDFDATMASFLAKPRNRVEFLRLFAWNDPNGVYESTLLETNAQVEEVFEDLFGDLVDVAPRVENYAALKKRLLRE